MAMAPTFHEFCAEQPFSYRLEVFQLLFAVSKNEMLGLLPLGFLRVFLFSEDEVDVILKRYYQYFLGA